VKIHHDRRVEDALDFVEYQNYQSRQRLTQLAESDFHGPLRELCLTSEVSDVSKALDHILVVHDY
jgi:hypothetical protein